jgi:putative DNA primase/helicase
MEPLIYLPQNDTGMAERVLHLHPDRYRYRTGLGWMVWRDTHWQADRSHSLIETIGLTVERCIAAADQLDPTGGDRSPREKFLRWCSSRQQTAALWATEKRLQTMVGVATVDGWDADPYSLNHAGGTVDLRDGSMRMHRQKDLITVCSPAVEILVTDVTGTRWGQFLDEIMPDPDLRAYLQRAIGSSLIGRQIDHAVFVAHGTGRNGKGTLFRAISHAVGPYYSAIPSTLLVEKGQTPHPTEIADLAGRRLVVSAEVPAGSRLDENKLKELSGGDRIKARFIGKDFFEFDPSHTLWICCNERPRVTATDNGTWRRIRVIPFETTIPVERVDRWLDDALEKERDTILTWAIEGARKYLAEGLGTCKAVDRATSSYREEEDVLAMALAEVCEIGEGLEDTTRRIHTAVGNWYADNGYKRQAPPIPVLGRELTKRGFGQRHDGLQRLRTGLRVRGDWATQTVGGWH